MAGSGVRKAGGSGSGVGGDCVLNRRSGWYLVGDHLRKELKGTWEGSH